MKIKEIDITPLELTKSIVKGVIPIVPLLWGDASGVASGIAGGIASVYGDWQNKVQFANVLDILTKHEQQLIEFKEFINNMYIEKLFPLL